MIALALTKRAQGYLDARFFARCAVIDNFQVFATLLLEEGKMGMPLDLVLVRHGESEGNVAIEYSKRGDNRFFTAEFRARHSSQWRLTDTGRRQAMIAGTWIRDNVGAPFDRYYTSEYLRARETAAYLHLPDARWYADFYLRERDRGTLDVVTHAELKTLYADERRRRRIDPFYWCPPGGESMATLCLRIDRVLDTLHRECDSKRVIMVMHGETMWAFRIRLERLSQSRCRSLDESVDPRDRIHNGQVILYTRINPQTNAVSPYMNWMYSACPTDPSLHTHGWEEIRRPSYSNDDLLAGTDTVKRLIV